MALPKLSKPDSRTLVFVLLTLAVSGTGAVLGAIFALGWQGATATTLLVDLLLLGWVGAASTRSACVARRTQGLRAEFGRCLAVPR